MTRREFKDMPSRIARLPRDKRGFPIPKFVGALDKNGEPDFRIVSPNHMANCVRQNRCWICGDLMGTRKAFALGPMCCINRVSSEPPSHYECAVFAAKACPFLSNPDARRRERNLPEAREVAGIMIERNPGVTAIWVTHFYSLIQVSNGVLFFVGEPEGLEFYARGRAATRAEIEASIASGLPHLEAIAKRDGRGATSELKRMRKRFDALLADRVPA
ncbi:hypothetical protein CN166_15865 [Sinorhizobium medicae]|uniref:hypothetical protein n=1 Tax=Sinorhizobium medicae TaxID=110321 RepID=UPI000FD3019C|nr:hypothetical protein [Sinorhizobium medicae]RVJ57992.1 hypothetical protein CN166_15865 [Sinorhizobium medicae]RVJ77419.1 hypothetical protein CN167_10910 [Sinorhizobium medicae]RVK20285.1 hypothetical protein CN165_10440 [Sinorhizobium medicae]